MLLGMKYLSHINLLGAVHSRSLGNPAACLAETTGMLPGLWVVSSFVHRAFILERAFQKGSEPFTTVHVEKGSLMVVAATICHVQPATLPHCCQQEGVRGGDLSSAGVLPGRLMASRRHGQVGC